MKRPMLAAVAAVTAVAALPAGASAASIALTASGSTQTIAYAAAPGEVNALEMHGTVNGGLDFRMPFFEYSAPLDVGTGCTGLLPTICGAPDKAYRVSVSLGDENDVASTNSYTQALQMNAGSGDDDVLAGGIDATADGGDGNDVMLLAANSLVTGHGGSGRDRIYGGLGAAAARLTGGTGGDLLVPDGSAFDTAQGGPGNDRLVSFGGYEVTLSGGSGLDTIVSRGGGAAVDAGAGGDVVDVRGDAASEPDSVACGSGHDVVWANADDDVAADCETVMRSGTAPALPKVDAAIDAAEALTAHRPNPSAL
jgi:Ca2+-binding RTX toxin-like protein